MDEINVRVILKGKNRANFLRIKQEIGLQTNSEVIRFLVTKYSKLLGQEMMGLTEQQELVQEAIQDVEKIQNQKRGVE